MVKGVVYVCCLKIAKRNKTMQQLLNVHQRAGRTCTRSLRVRSPSNISQKRQQTATVPGRAPSACNSVTAV
jgi:hypothetical protein